MRKRKNVVLLFSKVPEAGLVKTRLSVLKDGMFPPETACDLYRSMLLDVVEIICAALDDLEGRRTPGDATDDSAAPIVPGRANASASATGPDDSPSRVGTRLSASAGLAMDDTFTIDEYELIVSTTPAANVKAMRELLAAEGFDVSGCEDTEGAGASGRRASSRITVIADEGESFDAHYNHAFAQCWERGADCILSMGADMPALTKADVKLGFEQLHRLCDMPGGGIVLAPDQEMGVSVIGWTRDTAFDHTGVFYNADGLTVLPAYIAKAREAGLPALWLPPIPDVDTMADFFHNVTLVHALDYCAGFDDICPPRRTAATFTELGFREIRVAPNNLLDPREHIDR